jgi:hypothetical protein
LIFEIKLHIRWLNNPYHVPKKEKEKKQKKKIMGKSVSMKLFEKNDFNCMTIYKKVNPKIYIKEIILN